MKSTLGKIAKKFIKILKFEQKVTKIYLRRKKK